MTSYLPIYGLARTLMRWLPRWYLRRRYPAQRLADLIYFDFMPRCESASINAGAAADVRLALQLINLSPFPVVLDRAQLRFTCGGGTVTLACLERRPIASGEIISLHLHETLSDSHAQLIANSLPPLNAWLDGQLEFNSRVRSFGKRLTSMAGIQPTVVNASWRKLNRA